MILFLWKKADMGRLRLCRGKAGICDGRKHIDHVRNRNQKKKKLSDDGLGKKGNVGRPHDLPVECTEEKQLSHRVI